MSVTVDGSMAEAIVAATAVVASQQIQAQVAAEAMCDLFREAGMATIDLNQVNDSSNYSYVAMTDNTSTNVDSTFTINTNDIWLGSDNQTVPHTNGGVLIPKQFLPLPKEFIPPRDMGIAPPRRVYDDFPSGDVRWDDADPWKDVRRAKKNPTPLEWLDGRIEEVCGLIRKAA